MSDRPAVTRVVFEFEDGSRKVATGEDANNWAQWLDEGVGWAMTRGRSPPEIEYDEKPDWMGSMS